MMQSELWTTCYAWRDEISTTIAILATWWITRRLLHRSFWITFLPGTLLGFMIEFMTEPEWTYFVRLYIWRDVSPMIILGWGVVFTWLVVASDALQAWWFSHASPGRWRRRFRLMLTDFLVGYPLFLGNELFGLYGIKVWKYNDVLGWNTMIPILNYPLEGLVVMVFFTAVTPWIIRYWTEQ